MADAAANRFQGEVRRLIQDKLGLACYPLNRNVPLSSIQPGASTGDNLEIDLLAVAGKCGVLIETTAQASRNSEKIKRFVRHCEFVRTSPLELRERLGLLGHFSLEALDQLATISQWHYLYVGTSAELIDKRITARRFPETHRLAILNGEHYQYLKALARLIGTYAQYEFLAALAIGPADMDDTSIGEEGLTKPALEISNRIVAPHTERAGVYLLVFKPSELLRVGRVLRYRGQPIAIESEGAEHGYQRILIRDKLKKIAQFIGNNPAIVFPTSLTVVLSPDCEVENSGKSSPKVVIPRRYAALDIIDGQHRLFAYAQDQLSDRVREDARLLVTAIKFQANDANTINQYAARTFVSINSTHTRVKRSLIDMIAYDVLGDTSLRAIAAKILFDCTERPGKALSRVFKTGEFSLATVDGASPIPTVLVVDELRGCFDIAQLESDGHLAQVERTFGESLENLRTPATLVAKGVELLERYFSIVQEVFPRDWRNKDSRLMCAKYIGGFVRLLRSFIEEGLQLDEMRARLSAGKPELVRRYHGKGVNPSTVVVFDDSNVSLPTKRGTSTGQIHKLLRVALAASGEASSA